MGIDVYQIVTERIVERMAQGEIPWKKPYRLTGQGMAIKQNGKPYSFVNQMLLGEPGRYFTFKRASELGFKIKKGAKSRVAVFWKLLERDVLSKNDSGEYEIAVDGRVPLLRYYRVFHERDVEGYEPPKSNEPEFDESLNKVKIKTADDIIDDYCNTPRGPRLVHQDRIPCYKPSLDYIVLPEKKQFISISKYYSTLFHEMIHSTGHADRLDRKLNEGAFNRHSYSREELVAEIGAAYLSNVADLPEQDIDNHASYIQSWMHALKNNPKWIVWASSRAEQACRLILNEKDDDIEQQES